MKVVQINSTCGTGSTGKIVSEISDLLSFYGIDNFIIFGANGIAKENSYKVCDRRYTRVQSLYSHILGNYGFNSVSSTKKTIDFINSIKPDIVHLHNIHSHDFNIELLFEFLKKRNQKVIWTFHDCWAFTGYCTYFTFCKCSKWKTNCGSCPQKKKYSFLFDKSKLLQIKKKKLFEGMDITIVTPSIWMAKLVKESFFKEYPVEVINNGIDLSVFKPANNNADSLLEKYRIEPGKSIVLGVASIWEKRKGLDTFIKLSDSLDDNHYQIVLVGTNDLVDKKLPSKIISVHKTNNQRELASLYSLASVFVNPTLEENYPTVNLEAIACGTPVVTFNTGGSSEMITKENGIVVDRDDYDSLVDAIIRSCIKKEKQGYASFDFCGFDAKTCYMNYLKLYSMICK